MQSKEEKSFHFINVNINGLLHILSQKKNAKEETKIANKSMQERRRMKGKFSHQLHCDGF